MNLQDKRNWLMQFYTVAELSNLDDEIISALYLETQPKKVKIAALKDVDTETYRVNSIDGYVPVTQWRNKGTKPCVRLVTAAGRSITASTDHFFEMSTAKWKYAAFITPGEELLSESGPDEVISIEPVGDQEVFDFHIGHDNHRYFTNGISSHNSGSGKSLFMQNISVNWFTAGLNGIYLTLELSEGLCSMRIDSMVANCSTKDIFKNLDDVELKVRMAGKKSGKFQVKYLPAQSNVNDIRAFVKEFQVQTGCKLDFMMVDYLDLLMPVTAKVSPNDLFVKDKYVSEELRNLAKELNILFITASQLNRSAVDEVEFDHSHISGGISKINTADNVFGIFTSRAMRERGKYQLQLLKTRSSSGVGTKVDLDFNQESLRIVDCGETPTAGPTPNAILGKIKNKPTVTSGEVIDKSTGEITKAPQAEAQSAKVKAMLANLAKPQAAS